MEAVQVIFASHDPGSLVKGHSKPEIDLICKRRLTIAKALPIQLNKCTLISCAQMQSLLLNRPGLKFYVNKNMKESYVCIFVNK